MAILFLLYHQTRLFDYVYFDDSDYILENSFVLAGLTPESIKWAFSSFYVSNWHPLTWMSHMLDVSLFGIDPGWAHIHNYVLHGINSLLVYGFLLRISRSWWKSCCLSLIFLVHPLHVESVAWIAERKDLICALFFLVALLLYDNYRARPNFIRYTAVSVAFILSLLAKPMAVTFPVVILVLDTFVYRARSRPGDARLTGILTTLIRDIIEKLPLFALSAALCVIAIIAQHQSGAMADLELTSLADRIFNASYAYAKYLQQMMMPLDLIAFYALQKPPPFIDVLFPGLLLLAWMGVALAGFRKFPLAGAGFCWYMVTLLPVIGLIQVGSQAHADRYMYLPSIGILIAAVHLLPKRDSRYFTLAAILSGIIIIYLSAICFWQIGYWKNQNTLFTRVLQVAGPSYRAHLNLASDYTVRGMWEEAERHSEAAFSLRSDMPQSYQLLGDVALAKGEFKKAESFYRAGINLTDDSARLHNNLGIALIEQNKTTAALEAFEKALRLEPPFVQPKQNIERIRLLKAGGTP